MGIPTTGGRDPFSHRVWVRRAPRLVGAGGRSAAVPPAVAAGHRVELRDAAAVVRRGGGRAATAPQPLALRLVLSPSQIGDEAGAGIGDQLARLTGWPGSAQRLSR